MKNKQAVSNVSIIHLEWGQSFIFRQYLLYIKKKMICPLDSVLQSVCSHDSALHMVLSRFLTFLYHMTSFSQVFQWPSSANFHVFWCSKNIDCIFLFHFPENLFLFVAQTIFCAALFSKIMFVDTQFLLVLSRSDKHSQCVAFLYSQCKIYFILPGHFYLCY